MSQALTGTAAAVDALMAFVRYKMESPSRSTTNGTWVRSRHQRLPSIGRGLHRQPRTTRRNAIMPPQTSFP